MAKETHMQTIQTEIKGIAKAVGASLKRSGHQVPHSVLLHALAAALDKRDWHKLKASLDGQGTQPEYEMTAYKSQGRLWPSATVAASDEQTPVADSGVIHLYADTTLGLLRLASALLRPVSPLPINAFEAQQAAYTAIGTIAGTVVFKDLVIPATLDPQGWRINDPEDTVRKRMGIGSLSFAEFCFSTPSGAFAVQAEYIASEGWHLTRFGEQQLLDQLADVVPLRRLFPSGAKVLLGNAADLPPVGRGSVLTELLPAVLAGPAVKARFHTDDYRFEVDFDAQEYFAQASVDSLLAIAEAGFSGDYCTDNVAEFMQGRNEEIDEGFAYIHALQRSSMKDPPGFECRVDAEDFYRWMDAHRRSELAQWLCVRAEVSLSQADEPEVFGQWCWFTSDSACAQSFATQEAACIDAYDKLNLLEQAINGQL
jgi:hypothetical protein